MIDSVRDFLKLETAGGAILVVAAAAALVVANTPLHAYYQALIDVSIEVRIGEFQLVKPLLLWINDGLMALFFLLVGLELKREFIEGELSTANRVILPAVGAVGGMLVPAGIYAWINRADPVALQGWAIPAATDIAFALAILALLGRRVPLALRMFLVSIAIFDDIGAIVIVALFYSGGLAPGALAVAGACLLALYALNRKRVLEKAPYLFIGAIMWTAVVKSGVHATLAGVLLALFIPLRDPARTRSPLHELEHDLHTVVAFGVLPIFAFANAGLSLADVTPAAFLHPVSLGVLLGLFLGKQAGVFALCWLAVRLGLARLPDDIGWIGIYGCALLCGVGFTMSLFIGSLAFENTGVNLLFDERLGIIAGSLLSGLAGYLVLRLGLPARDGRS